MKIAISAQGAEVTSPVDPRFGRAKYFIVCDTETGDAKAHNNQVNLNAAQGAGIQAAKTVADFGVQALITGNVGPKAFTALTAAGVAVHIGAIGTVADALDAFKAGRLGTADQANVEGHW